jgi:hypothetical protein
MLTKTHYAGIAAICAGVMMDQVTRMKELRVCKDVAERNLELGQQLQLLLDANATLCSDLQSANNTIEYLTNVLQANGIEPDEFDLIAIRRLM